MTTERRLSRSPSAIVAFYAFLVAMLGTTLPTPLYVLYRHRFGFSELTITIIFATYAAGVIAGLMLFGRLSDDRGRRPILLLGLGLSALSAVAFLLANGLPMLLVGRFISGLSAGIFTGTATATLVDLVKGERATLAAAVANMGGLGLGPLIAGMLIQWAGDRLRLTFWVDLALLVPAAAGVWLMAETREGAQGAKLRVQGLTVPREIRAMFVRASLAGFAGFAVMGLFTAVSPAFLVGVLGEKSHIVLGLLVWAVFAASTAGQLALGRVGGGWAMPAGCGGLIAGMGVLAVGLAASSLALLAAGGVVAGLGQGLSFRAALAELNDAAPGERRAEVASSFFVVAYVALSIPVIGEGVLAQIAGLRAAGLVFAAAVALLAAVVLALLARDRAH
jgi:MFS family permease